MNIKMILSVVLFLATSVGLHAQRDYTQYVNPNIGVTHSRWFFYTPAAMPFGLAKLGPSTNGTYGNKQGWETVGYQDDHRTIDGFPCLHEFQIGGIALMPVMDDEQQFGDFAKNTGHDINVPFSDRTVVYDSCKRTGVATTCLGASRAIALGAYHFAVNQLNH